MPPSLQHLEVDYHFKLQLAVKIEPESVLACFTNWVLPCIDGLSWLE